MRQCSTSDNPSILDFSDPRAFVLASLKARRQQDARMSLRQFAKRAGFRSASTLSMILTRKRRLTRASAEKLAKVLELSGRDRKYFLTLAEFDESQSEDLRAELKESLLRLKASSGEEFQLQLHQYRFLANWFYPTIYVLVGTDSFVRDPEWIARRLNGKVTSNQVRQAIGDMLNLGLLRDEAGKLIQSEPNLATRDDFKDVAIRRYHTQMSELGLDALSLPIEEREFNGLTVSICRTKLPEVKEKIREFRRMLHSWIEADKEVGPTDVFQLNIQLFPITKLDKESLQ